MQRSIYIRPVGLMARPSAPTASGEQTERTPWHGLPLAGGSLNFVAAEVIERKATTIGRETIVLGDLFERDWRRDPAMVAETVDALVSPRARLAGLSLDRPRIMGIVNVTPDSFSDGGKLGSVAAAVEHGLKLVEEGADILDIGGESTRPGAEPVALEEELRRVLPVIEGLRAKTDAAISIDTRKAEVMRRAAAAGADILNDVSALSHDPDALRVAAESGLPVMLMHAQGDPRTMNDNPVYSDVVLDVFDYLALRIEACAAAGIPRSKLVADPGIGFGKHLHHNVAVLASLSIYHGLGVPILLGASRKGIIGKLSHALRPEDRVPGSIAAALSGIAQGVQIVRAHDVAATRQAIAVWQAISVGREAEG